MKKFILLFLFCALFASILKAQDRVTSNPDSARIITSDIDNFWKAFDLLQNQRTSKDSLNVIKTKFVDKASEGLKQYMKAANCYEQQYLETIRKRKADYLAVREKTRAVAMEKQLIIKYLRQFKQLYPALKIPAICFTIGKFEVGGSQFDNTLYIGCETDARQGVDIAIQAIHELAHFQQKNQNQSTNLDLAMIEGGAEFICHQVTGRRTLSATWTYGLANEHQLWQEFSPKLDSAFDMTWFRDIPDKATGRPGSLAYLIGYRVCEAYLKSRSDKKRAMTELIEMEDPKKIFSMSLYK